MCTFWSSFWRSKFTIVKLWENLNCEKISGAHIHRGREQGDLPQHHIRHNHAHWCDQMATYNHHNKNDHSTESWQLIVLCLAFFTSNKCDQVMLIFRRWCCRCNMSALLLTIKSGRVPKIKICQPRCLSWNQSKTSFKSDLQRSQHCDFLGSPQ